MTLGTFQPSPPKKPKDPMSRGLVLWVGFVLLLVSLVPARRALSPGRWKWSGGAQPQAAPPPGIRAAERSAKRVSGGPAAPAPEADEDEPPLSVDELMSMLEARVPKETARAAAIAFIKEPALRKAWGRFTKARGKKAPASEFVEFLTKVPQFKSFVAKHGSDPAVEAAFDGLLRDRRFADAVRAEPGAGTASRPLDIIREWERLAVSGVDTGSSAAASGGAAAAGPGALAAQRGRGAASAAHTSVSNLSGGSSIGGGSAGGGKGAGGSNTQALKASGAEAHNVSAKLDTLFKTKAAGDKDTTEAQRYRDEQRRWITKFLAALQPDSARKAIQGRLESGAEDQWGACFITGNYNLCRNVCAQVPEANCESKTPYWACRGVQKAGGEIRDPVDCIKRCIYGNPMSCEPDYSEWTPLCKEGTRLLQAECRNSMEWGPCQDDGSGFCVQQFGLLGGAVAGKKLGGKKPPVGPGGAAAPPGTVAAGLAANLKGGKGAGPGGAGTGGAAGWQGFAGNETVQFPGGNGQGGSAIDSAPVDGDSGGGSSGSGAGNWIAGAIGGAVVGAVVGGMIGGPIGIGVGAVTGAVVGGLIGAMFLK